MKRKSINIKKLEKDLSGEWLPDVLVEEVLDDLEAEEAGVWLLSHLNSDSSLLSEKHIYSTSLFSVTVDFRRKTVGIASELACHPADEVLDLQEFTEILAQYLAIWEGRNKKKMLARENRRNRDFRHDILPS